MNSIFLSKQQINQLPASSILYAGTSGEDLYLHSFDRYYNLGDDEIKDNKNPILENGFKGDYPSDKSQITNYFVYHFVTSDKTANNTSIIIFQNAEFLDVFLKDGE